MNENESSIFAMAALGRTERAITIGAIVLLVFLFAACVALGVKGAVLGLTAIVLLAIVAGTFLYAPSRLELRGNHLVLGRRIGATIFSLKQPIGVDVLSAPFKGTVRKMGVGGMFGYFGRFATSDGTPIVAHVTDSTRVIAVKCGDVILYVSPESGDAFKRALLKVAP